MNARQLERNKGRIPRLNMHIKRVTAKAEAAAKAGDTDGPKGSKVQMARVESFQSELDRRCLEMRAAGHDKLTDAHLGPGLYFFAGYGLLSMSAGLLLARAGREPGVAAR